MISLESVIEEERAEVTEERENCCGSSLMPVCGKDSAHRLSPQLPQWVLQ